MDSERKARTCSWPQTSHLFFEGPGCQHFPGHKGAVLVNGSDDLQRGLGPGILHPGTEEVSEQLHLPQLPGSQGNGGWEDKIPTETMRLGCSARKWAGSTAGWGADGGCGGWWPGGPH